MRTILLSLAVVVAAANSCASQASRAPAAAPRAETPRLAARADSFEVRAAGRALGWQSARMVPSGSGFRYEETTSVGPTIQRTVVELDSAGAVRSVAQRGSMNGTEMRIDLRYGGGRVSGQALTPLSAGKEVAIDQELAAGTVDDNAMQAILPTLRWSPSAQWVFPVFSSGKGTVTQQTLRVTGVETVAVPAGEFSAYRAELSGGERPVVFWVSAQAPHPVVRIAVPGTPIEFVRIR
ncbi:MAG TPA: hypothetical protein VF613_06950 [Longimicrobium sp.]|jgi:hypothetical protein